MLDARSLAMWTLGTMLAASPARALGDLTGTWEGTMICENANAGLFQRVKSGFLIRIDDDPSGDAFAELPTPAHIRVIPHPDSPTRGRVIGTNCVITPENGGFAFDLAVKVKDGSDTGTMRGTFLGVGLGAAPGSSTCKVKAKRTSTTIPAPILGCPL